METKPSRAVQRWSAWWTLALLVLAFNVAGQGSIEVDGTVREKDSNRKLAGVEVQVFRAGATYDAVSTLSNGKYSLTLDHGSDYELKFTFQDLSPRKVILKTSTIPEAFRERPFYLTVEMSLFEVPPGFDQDLLEEPIGKVSFDPAKEQLAWDLNYTATMQSRIEAELNVASADAGEDAGTNAEYEEHMRKAEVEFGRERWEQSINWLERALTEVPGDGRAEGMLSDARERLAAAEQEANARRDYEVQMREGKLAMRKEDWSTARAAFEAAVELLPGEQEPRDLLAEIEAATAADADAVASSEAAYDAAMATGESAMASGDLDAAEQAFEEASGLKPSEREPRDRLAAVRQMRKAAEREAGDMERRRAEYEGVIERADAAFDDQDFLKAKGLYEQATAIFPDEIYPRTRAVEAAGLIVPIGGVDSDASEPETDVEWDAVSREYEDRIREGDTAFDAEDWPAATDAYNAALALRPEERYPKNRLRRIETLTSGNVEVAGDLAVDREALMAESEAQAAASADAAAAIQEEQARMLEEERLARDAEAERRASDAKSRENAGLDRSRNYVLAMQNVEEDDAEAYYRDALKSEIRARGQAVYARMEQQTELNEVWLANGDTRRQSSYRSMAEQQAMQETALASAAGYREDRRMDLEARTTRYDENASDFVAKGNASRRDRFVSLTRKDERGRAALHDRTKRYAVFVDSLDRMLDAYADYNRDLRRASVDARIMRYEEIERRVAQYARIGEGASIRRLDNLNGVRKLAQEDAQTRQLAAGEASIRAASALRRVHDQESGEAPTSEDYHDVPAKEGIRQGVEERSYENGNALVIERTVRVDNEVNVYRKTVAKHGVYYFKNDHSITREIWVLETFEITD